MRAVEESASKSAVSASLSADNHDMYTAITDSCNPMTDSSGDCSLSSNGHGIKNYLNDSMTDTSEQCGQSEHTLLQPRESELLMDMLGSILAQVFLSPRRL